MAQSNFPNRPFRLQENSWVLQQDIGGNRTLIRTQVWIYKNSYSPTWSNNPSYWSLSVDGREVANGQFTYNFTNSDQLLLVQRDTWVYHNGDGTKAVRIQSWCNAAILGETSTDGTLGLPRIPRASGIRYSPSPPLVAGENVTIYTDRADPSFKHTITYRFGNRSGTIATGVETQYTWQIPLVLLDQSRGSLTGTGTFTVTTYQGSTQIGSTSRSFTLRPPADTGPLINNFRIREYNTAVAALLGTADQDNPPFLQGVSVVETSMDLVPQHYAYLDRVENNIGENFASQSYPSGSTSGSRIRNFYVNTVGSAVPNKATAYDSRGYSRAVTRNMNILPYSNPKINSGGAQRANADGSVNDQGTRIRVDLNAQVQSILISSAQKNKIKVTYEVSDDEGETWTLTNEANPTAISVDGYVLLTGTYPEASSFQIRVTVSDGVGSNASAIYTVPTAVIFQHWNGNEGMGLRKYHERGTLDVNGDIYADNYLVNDGVNARSIVPGTPGIPFQTATGISSINRFFPTIMFPAGRFTAPPIVTAQIYSGAGAHLGVITMVTNASAASFQARVVWPNNAANDSYVDIHWHAIQMTPTSGAG